MKLWFKAMILFFFTHECVFANEELRFTDFNSNGENSICEPQTQALINDLAVSTKDNNIFEQKENYEFTPSPLALWISVIASICLGLFNLYDNWTERKKIYLKSINDDFWFRTIVVPTVLEPLVIFANEFSNKLVNHDFIDNEEFLDKLESELAVIRERFILLEIFRKDLYRNLNDYSDEFEDCITEYCYEQTSLNQNIDSKKASSIIFDFLKKIIESIKILHNAI